MLNKKKPQVDSVDTVVGIDTIFEGTITSKTSLRVEGKIQGEVVCEGDITIGKEGHVEHSIKARNVTLAGTITGDVEAKEKLHILSSGKLSGNATMAALMIEEGAVFEGQSNMSNQKESNASHKKKEENNKKKA